VTHHPLAAAVGAVTALALMATPCWADCRASLVTGIDASASVGADGLRMQIDGLTAALADATVIQAFGSQNCVRFALYAWSDNSTVVLLPWTDIGTPADAASAIAQIRKASTEYDPPVGVLTDVSEALEVAEAMFGQIPPTGRRVANLVLDGEDNVGDGPQLVATRMRAEGIRINAVTFGTSATLEAYMRANVTNGFVLRIDGPADFARTYVQKFRMDLSLLVTP
jgi:hypothetical protein